MTDNAYHKNESAEFNKTVSVASQRLRIICILLHLILHCPFPLFKGLLSAFTMPRRRRLAKLRLSDKRPRQIPRMSQLLQYLPAEQLCLKVSDPHIV